MSESKLQLKIANLLRHAEKAATPEESEAYQARAQALATRYSIDMQLAAAAKINSERRPELIQEGIRIGDRGKRGLHPYYDLLQAIATENNVRMTLLSDASYAWMHGYDNDVETTKALYTSLLTQMIKESDAYIRSGAYKSETTYRAVRVKTSWGGSYTDWKEAPVHGKTARRSFLEAFTYKVSARLREARCQAEQDAANSHFHNQDTPLEIQAATSSESVAVAIRERTKEVANFYTAKNPRLRTHRRSSTSTHSSHAASAGREAGARARLSAPKALAG
jgi:hypothetical protein